MKRFIVSTTAVILIIIGAVPIIVAITSPNQAEQQFQRHYALNNFFKVNGFNTANAQSASPFANCISLFMAGDAVQLTEDEDCNSSLWQEAVQYYKTNGYPNEGTYMDFGYGKFIELDSDKFVQDKKDLGMK